MIFANNSVNDASKPKVVILYLDPKLAKKSKPKLSFVQFDKRILFKFTGIGLTTLSILTLVYFFGPYLLTEAGYRLLQVKRESTRIMKDEPKKEPVVQFSDLMGKAQFENIPAPKDTNFGIVIPKININIKVVPNVNAEKQSIFMPALLNGVAHAQGTALPGGNGTILIFAHSALYEWDIAKFNAVFYQIKDLVIGDEINIFYNQRRYYYKVYETKIVKPTEVSFLLEDKGEQLVLQTCWPLGSVKERLLVFAKPVEVNQKVAI